MDDPFLVFVDFNHRTSDKECVSRTKKTPSKASRRARESRTWGTRMADEIRGQCNKLTRSERENLLERAMKLAYGADAQPAQNRRR